MRYAVIIGVSQIRGRTLHKEVPELIVPRKFLFASAFEMTPAYTAGRLSVMIVTLLVRLSTIIEEERRRRKRRRRAEVPQFIHCASLAQSLESALVMKLSFVNAEIVRRSPPIRVSNRFDLPINLVYYFRTQYTLRNLH